MPDDFECTGPSLDRLRSRSRSIGKQLIQIEAVKRERDVSGSNDVAVDHGRSRLGPCTPERFNSAMSPDICARTRDRTQ